MAAVRQWNRHCLRIIVIQDQSAAPLKYHVSLPRQPLDFDFNKVVFDYGVRVIIDSDTGTERAAKLILLWNRLLWERMIVKWPR